MRSRSATLAACFLVLFCTCLPHQALADAVTDISFAYGGGTLNPPGNWATQINGPSIVAAPQSGNSGTGISFANWSGQFNEVDNGVTRTFNFSPVAVTSGGVVHTLLNTFYGSGNLEAEITFTNDQGSSAMYGLTGDQTIRDYNNAVFANDLLGYNATAGLGEVTAQNWWSNGQGQRLDVQTFILPSAWAGSDLTSMTITDPVNSGGTDILSALQIDDPGSNPVPSPAPEPSTLVLLSTGIVALARRAKGRSKSNPL